MLPSTPPIPSPDPSTSLLSPPHLNPPWNGDLSAGAHSAAQPPPTPPKPTHLAAIYPTPRPSSLPSSSSFPFPLSIPTPPTPAAQFPWPPEDDPLQRYSSASLPLPHQIPYHALPKSGNQNFMTVSIPANPRPTSPSVRSPADSRPQAYSNEINSSSSSSSPASTSSTTTTTTSSSKLSAIDATSCSPPASPTANDPSPYRPRSISPPPTLSSRFQSSDLTTAMRRFMSSSSNSHQSSSESAQSQPTFPPPPDPPVILPQDPPNDITLPASSLLSRAPYMPFLSNAPPPPDCSIQVETTHAEYRLNVRLPGFSREGITLATKRRRILHVVADNWENGGGHFERRISFGYDADLVQVRAEFDGVMLRIFIPRRVSPVNWYYPRPGPIGRA